MVISSKTNELNEHGKPIILVVDDDPNMLLETNRLLSKNGYEVVQAKSGTECLKIAIIAKPALILLDVFLPDMDGYEVCRLVKLEEKLSNTFVVILSGKKNESKEPAEGLKTEADGYITRPIGNNELLARIELFLRLQRSQVTLQEKKAELAYEQSQMQFLFEEIDDVLYVSDPETYDLLYANPVARKTWGNDIIGKKCFQVLQNMNIPCDFCSNHLIFGENLGKTHVWELQNKVNKRWYRCVDKAIRWPDGRLVRFEQATDITESKKMQHERDAYLDFSQDLIGTIGPDGYLKYTNQSWMNTLGYSSEELYSNSIMSLIHPDDVGSTTNEIKAIFNGLPTANFENRYVKKNGEIIHFLWTAVLLPETDLVLGIGRDITIRKKAEQNLQEKLQYSKVFAEMSSKMVEKPSNEEDITDLVLKYAKTLTKSNYGYVSIIDQKTKENIAYTHSKMMGVDCDLTGKDKRIVFPPNEDGSYPRLWGHALNTKRSFYTNTPNNHNFFKGVPKGHISINNFLSAPALIEDTLVGQIALANKEEGYNENDLNLISQLASLFAVAVNRKNTEDLMIASESKYRRLIGNIVGLVYCEKPNGHLDIVSNLNRLNGYFKSALTQNDLHWKQYIHPDDRDRVFKEQARLVEAPGTLVHEYRVIGADKKIYHIQDSKRSFFHKGIFQGIDGVAIDITERKKSEEIKEKLIQYSPIGISLYDTHGQCIAANKSMAAILGGTYEQIMALNYNQLETWRKTGLYQKALQALQQNVVEKCEVDLISSFGKSVVLDCHLIPFEQNFLMVMINDVTEQRQIEIKEKELLVAEAIAQSEKERSDRLENINTELIKMRDELTIKNKDLQETQAALVQRNRQVKGLALVFLYPKRLLKHIKVSLNWIVKQRKVQLSGSYYQ